MKLHYSTTISSQHDSILNHGSICNNATFIVCTEVDWYNYLPVIHRLLEIQHGLIRREMRWKNSALRKFRRTEVFHWTSCDGSAMKCASTTAAVMEAAATVRRLWHNIWGFWVLLSEIGSRNYPDRNLNSLAESLTHGTICS